MMPWSLAGSAVDIGFDCHERKPQIYCDCLHFVWIIILCIYLLEIPFSSSDVSVWVTKGYRYIHLCIQNRDSGLLHLEQKCRRILMLLLHI